MLQHTVLMRVREDVEQQDVDVVFSYIQDLKRTLPGIMNFTCGPSAQLDHSDKQYSHGFSMVFVDQDYFDEYRSHPKYTDTLDRIGTLLADSSSLVTFNYQF